MCGGVEAGAESAGADRVALLKQQQPAEGAVCAAHLLTSGSACAPQAAPGRRRSAPASPPHSPAANQIHYFFLKSRFFEHPM